MVNTKESPLASVTAGGLAMLLLPSSFACARSAKMTTPWLTDAAAGGACAGRLDVLIASGDQLQRDSRGLFGRRMFIFGIKRTLFYFVNWFPSLDRDLKENWFLLFSN